MANPGSSSTSMAVYQQKALDQIVARLATEFRDVSRERIATVVRLEHDLFHGSRIRGFVPILVERVVRRRLACGSAEPVGNQPSGVKVRTKPECEPGRCWSCL